MDVGTFEVEAEVEATHWWFVNRRELFARQIAGLGLPANAKVLDVGSSTGTNLRMLRDRGFTDVTGLDPSPVAIEWCRIKGLPRVQEGSVTAIPFPDATFDLVLATDIIEHVDEDDRALAEIRRVLKPGGHVLVTVPTFAGLWGLQDEVSHHKRRYRLSALLDLVHGAGLLPMQSFYFNFILFVPIWLARRIIGTLRVKLRSEGEVNAPWLNRLLGAIFRLDVAAAPLLKPPFGVSGLVLARKAGA